MLKFKANGKLRAGELVVENMEFLILHTKDSYALVKEQSMTQVAYGLKPVIQALEELNERGLLEAFRIAFYERK